MSHLDDLAAGAAILEMEIPDRFWTVSSINPVLREIDRWCTSDDGELHALIPIAVPLNGQGELIDVTARVKKDGVGLAAVFDERIVVAWMTGTIRLKTSSYSMPFRSIVDLRRHHDPLGLRIDEATDGDRSTVALLIHAGLPESLALSYCGELATAIARSSDVELPDWVADALGGDEA